MPVLAAELVVAFQLIGLSPACRDASVLKETRRRVLLDNHPDKLGDQSVAAQERFVQLKDALDRVMLFFRDEEDRRAAGLPPTWTESTPVAADAAEPSAATPPAAPMPNRNQMTTRYWFEDAFDELLPCHHQLLDRDLPKLTPLETWTREMNEAVAKWTILPPKPERGLPRELGADDKWTPQSEYTRPAPQSTEEADYLGPSMNESAPDQLVCDQDRLRQPRRHLWSKTGAKQGVSIHRRVEDYLETNVLAEEINHDFGVFETPTYRSTMRAYTSKRTEHLSNLYVYSEREKQVRQADVAARMSGALVKKRTSKAEMTLEEMRSDVVGFAAYQEQREERERLARMQYETRATMQRKLSAVCAVRAEAGKTNITKLRPATT